MSGVDLDRVRAIASALASEAGALLPVLHAVQAAFGHVPPESVPVIAAVLNLSRADVHGVVSFYHAFRTSPPGRTIVQVCRAESCQAAGGRAIEAHAQRRLGVEWHGTTADGAFTLEPVFCLGLCASSPAVMVGDVVHGGMTSDRFDALVFAAPRVAPPVASMSTSSAPLRAGAVRVFVPGDSGVVALGADDVAEAIARRAPAGVTIVRNGSRGAYWLEPLVEVDTPDGRIGYGPVQTSDVDDLFAAGFLDGGAHRLRLGRPELLPFFATQDRLTCARLGIVDPRSLEDYLATGGFAGLERALAMSPEAIVQEVTESGLRGRGGAAFPTGVKWRTVLEQTSTVKYIACNADEGDSGTFSDRMLMEGDPFLLLEGMTIAGLAVGATEGFIYLRIEYPHAARTLAAAITAAERAGYLGSDVRGSGRRFTVRLRIAAGAYICGEETSMLESLEGKRGEVRVRPPLPAVEGLFGQPTVVNNVVTLASVPGILQKGAAHYHAFGHGRSRGTIPLQLGGNVARGGLVEKAFGVTLRELIEDYGGGTASGRPLRAVQVGGPLGAYIPTGQLDTPIDYEALTEIGALLGHGGVVLFDDTVQMAEMARYALEFCANESCGKCTPCRIGSTRGVEIVDRIRRGDHREAQLTLLEELCTTLEHGSLCGLGGLTPYPVRSAIRHFRGDF